MSRKFGQGRFKLEASANVVSVVPGVDELSLDYAELNSHVLEGWWVELDQEVGDVLNECTAAKLDAYYECVQLLPFRPL